MNIQFFIGLVCWTGLVLALRKALLNRINAAYKEINAAYKELAIVDAALIKALEDHSKLAKEFEQHARLLKFSRAFYGIPKTSEDEDEDTPSKTVM